MPTGAGIRRGSTGLILIANSDAGFVAAVLSLPWNAASVRAFFVSSGPLCPVLQKHTSFSQSRLRWRQKQTQATFTFTRVCVRVRVSLYK